MLSDVLEVQNGYAFDSKAFNPSNGMPLIRIRSLKEGTENETRFSGDYDEKYVVQAGDFLIGMDGEFGCYEWKGSPALLNQRVCRLQSFNSELAPRFLFYGVNSYLKAIEDVTGYTTVKHLSSKQILGINFPLPPLPEQYRIVAILDEAFENIAAAKVNAEQNLKNARALFESHLQAVFSQRGEGWVEATLGDVCKFENGDRGKNYPHRTEYVESGIPWINTGHIQRDGTLSTTGMNFISPEKFNSLRSGKIQPGDLVYCLRGATLGKTALVDPFAVGAVASSLVILRPNSLLDSRYLYSFLTSPHGQDLIKGYENGAAQPNLGAKSVSKYPISLPPIAEQKQLVAKIDDFREETQRLESIYKQKFAALDELKKALLHKAFAGEL